MADENKIILTDSALSTLVDEVNTKIDGAGLSPSKILISNSKGEIATSYLSYSNLDNLDGIERNIQTQLNEKINSSDKGKAGGIATLGSDGKIPAAQLPSYIDDIIEGYESSGKWYNDALQQLESGQRGKLYYDTLTKVLYRWSGSTFVALPDWIDSLVTITPEQMHSLCQEIFKDLI